MNIYITYRLVKNRAASWKQEIELTDFMSCRFDDDFVKGKNFTGKSFDMAFSDSMECLTCDYYLHTFRIVRQSAMGVSQLLSVFCSFSPIKSQRKCSTN